MIWNAVRSGLGSDSTSQRPLGDRPLGPLPYSATGAQRPASCVARVVLPVRASITRTAVLPALSISVANAVVQPGAPITCPRSATTRPLESMTVVLSAPPRTNVSLARVAAGEVDPVGLKSWPAEPQAAATIPRRTAAARSRRITPRTTGAAGGSLPQTRGDPDGFLQAHLRLETVCEFTFFPEEGVPGKAKRFGLDPPGGIEEEELMRLPGEVVSDSGPERDGVEGRPRSDGLGHDLGLEAALEFDDDRAHSGLR